MTPIDQLKEDFYGHEIETVEELLQCAPLPNTASKFRRMVMLFLRAHYSSSENYPDDASFKCLVYSPDKKDSTLEVGFSHLDDFSDPDNYPGIFVTIGDVKFTKLGMGNRAGYSEDLATTHMTKQADLALVIQHVAKEAHVAYDMADMTAFVLTAMAHPMVLNSGALSMEVEGFGKPITKNESPSDYYTVALVVKISYTFNVSRSIESHRIKTIASILQTDH